jgi:7-carboxy-7-deazaguanine synthase (Cx14CxxC type)
MGNDDVGTSRGAVAARPARASKYRVHEIFLTLQGEGFNTGTAAVFCRFSGCNLWSGHERHRATARCTFCDTTFVGVDGDGGGTFSSPDELAATVEAAWAAGAADRLVVCTGGEPLLQLDPPLIDAFHRRDFRVAVETNGTLAVPDGVDWVCVSPKSGVALVTTSGDELKLVHPQDGIDPSDLIELHFDHRFLQPMDGPHIAQNTALAVQYCLDHPEWRLSTQTHKHLGIR